MGGCARAAPGQVKDPVFMRGRSTSLSVDATRELVKHHYYILLPLPPPHQSVRLLPNHPRAMFSGIPVDGRFPESPTPQRDEIFPHERLRGIGRCEVYPVSLGDLGAIDFITLPYRSKALDRTGAGHTKPAL